MSRRLNRVEEACKEVLSEVIRREVKDPRVGFVTITSVKLSSDLRHAKVYISVPGQYERQYAGLFTVIEQIDQTFFKDRWGKKVGVLVKPEGLRGCRTWATTGRAMKPPMRRRAPRKRVTRRDSSPL